MNKNVIDYSIGWLAKEPRGSVLLPFVISKQINGSGRGMARPGPSLTAFALLFQSKIIISQVVLPHWFTMVQDGIYL